MYAAIKAPAPPSPTPRNVAKTFSQQHVFENCARAIDATQNIISNTEMHQLFQNIVVGPFRLARRWLHGLVIIMSGCCISFRGCRGRYVSGRSESSQAGRLSLTWIYGQLSSLSAGRCGPAPLVQCRCAPRPSSGHAILPDLPRTELQRSSSFMPRLTFAISSPSSYFMTRSKTKLLIKKFSVM